MKTALFRSFGVKSAFGMFVVLLASGFALAPCAFARPEMAARSGADRFAAMDADKNGALGREEFFTAQPHMKDAAFDAIDTDKSGAISLEEWLGFTAGHGKDMPASHPGSALGGQDGQDGGGVKKGPGEAPGLIMPSRSPQ